MSKSSHLSRRQQGFSLVEIFISLAAGVVLFAGVLAVFSGMRTTTGETESIGEMQENGRFAVSIITEDLMRVGFWGQLPEALSASRIVSNSVTIVNDCVGDGVNNGTFPIADAGHFRVIWGQELDSSDALGCIDNAKSGSDLIHLKRLLAAPVEDMADLDDARVYMNANINSAAIFHGGIGSSNVPNIPVGDVWEFQHHIYYVREDARGGNTVPSLVKGYLLISTPASSPSTAAFEFQHVVEGVEAMSFRYGVDSDNDGVANLFLDPEDMTDSHWDHEVGNTVVAVQVDLLIRDIFPDQQYLNENTYVVGNKTFSFDAEDEDHYRRMVYSTTVALHNSRTETWPK